MSISWLLVILISGVIALWGFGDPLFNRLNTGIPDAANSESWRGQKLIDSKQYQDYSMIARISGVDLTAIVKDAETRGKEVKDLADKAEAKGNEAKELGKQAEAKGKEAEELGAQAAAADSRRAALELMEKAQDAGALAADWGAQAQALGAEAASLGAQAAEKSKVDWPLAEAINRGLAGLENQLKQVDGFEKFVSPFTPANALLDERARHLVASDSKSFALLVVADYDDGSGKLDEKYTSARQQTELLLALAGGKLTQEIQKVPGYEHARVTSQVTDSKILMQSGIANLKHDLVKAESIGIPLSFVIMMLVFGGVLAALMPLGGALVAISTSLAVMLGMTYVTEQQSFSVNVISVLGLGLSIDYGLLIVSRYREEMARLKELDPSEYAFDPACVRRQRTRERLSRRNPRYLRALEITLNTAGRTVVFSSLTVAISIVGMLFFEPELLRSLGIAGVCVVLLAVASAITLIPALLTLAGRKMERASFLHYLPGIKNLISMVGETHSLPPKQLAAREARRKRLEDKQAAKLERKLKKQARKEQRQVERDAARMAREQGLDVTETVAAAVAEVEEHSQHLLEKHMSRLHRGRHVRVRRWRGMFVTIARSVRRHPWFFFVGSTTLLIVLALPIGSLTLRNSLMELMPLKSPQRILMQELQEIPQLGFPILNVVVKSDDTEAVDKWAQDHVADLQNVDAVGYASPLGNDYRLLKIEIAGDDPAGPVGEAIVHQLRDMRADAPFDYLVTGQVANQVDFVHELAVGLPYSLAVVVLATFVLLFLMTGSVVVPLQALVLNAFSLMSTLGLSTWIFQGGHGASWIGFEKLGGLESYVVVMLFCFGFGLSMDYEVFLLSRIKEVWDQTGNNKRAVERGLARSSRIITSAATILVFVFLSFAFGDMVILKQVGLVLAIGVFIDATIVRMALVPSAMLLLGRANWWAPKPLARFHKWFTRNVNVHG